MAKDKDRKPTPKPTPGPTPAPTPHAATDKESPIDSRFAIPLDKDGKVLVETMRDTSRAKLRELLTDRTLAKSLGVQEDAAAAPLSLPPQLMYPLVGALSIFETLLIQRVTKAPREIVERVAGFSREETQQLAPALASVLSKYGSTFLNKYGEETALIAMLSMMTMNKLALVREEMERLGPRGIVVPMSPPPPPNEPEGNS